MISIGAHESVRILAPAILGVGLMRLFFPAAFPGDVAELVVVAALAGIVFAPLGDRLAKRWFHRQIIILKFYDRFVEEFARRNKIPVSGDAVEMASFSGTLSIQGCAHTDLILEAYKVFARRGWGGSADTYRVRTEKSFGMLYYSMFLYSLAVLIVISVAAFTSASYYDSLTGSYWGDSIALGLVGTLCFIESTSRFRMSINNELIVLEGHPDELKSIYESLLVEDREPAA